MRLAVIGPGAAGGGHHNFVGALGHGKRAKLLGDLVVALLCGGTGPVDLVRVGAGADGGLGAGDLEVRGLAVYKAVNGTVGGQGLAVVGLAVGLGHHAERCLLDLISAIEAAAIVALAGDGYRDGAISVGEVGAVVVADLVIGALDEDLVAVLNDRDPLVLLAVVGRIGRIVDRHAALALGVRDDGLGGNGQRALILGLDGVVGRFRGAPLDGIAVLGRAGIGLGAVGNNGRGLIVHEAGDAVGGSGCRQGRAVVDLRRARRAHGKRCRGNPVGLGRSAGVVADALDGNGNGADVGRVVAVRHGVVAAGNERLAAGVLDLGHPLLLGAVVDDIARVGDGSALVAVRVGRIRHDGLSGNRQGSKLRLGNLVIAIVAFLQLVGNGVVRRANFGLRARAAEHRVPIGACSQLVEQEAAILVRQNLVAVPVVHGSERRSVVDLGSALGLQLNRALGDGDCLLAVCVTIEVIGPHADLYRRGRIVGVAPSDFCGVAAPLGVDTALDAVLDVEISRNCVAIVIDGGRSCGSSRVCIAIVDIACIVAVNSDVLLGREQRDAQRALVLGNGVVACLEGIALGVGDFVVVIDLVSGVVVVSNRAGGLNVGYLTGHEASVAGLLPAGNGRPLKSSAVVGLGPGIGRQRDAALIDSKRLGAGGVVAVVAVRSA